jgi:hypothetical protein
MTTIREKIGHLIEDFGRWISGRQPIDEGFAFEFSPAPEIEQTPFRPEAQTPFDAMEWLNTHFILDEVTPEGEAAKNWLWEGDRADRLRRAMIENPPSTALH